MKNQESLNLDINNLPEPNDKAGWAEYAENAKKVGKKHYQSGETIFSTFGDEIATKALKRYIGHTKRIGILHRLDAPDILLEDEMRSVKKEAGAFREGKISHEDIAKYRDFLDEMPRSVKTIQNQIFTMLLAIDKDTRSRYLLETINPRMLRLKGDQFWRILVDKRPEQIQWYDLIGKLSEINADGQPVVSDETFTNFFEWYQASLAKNQEELNEEAPKLVSEYSYGLREAVSQNRLPQSLEDNLSFFSPSSPRSRNLNFSLFDMLSYESGAAGAFSSPEIFLADNPEAPIGIRVDVAAEETEKYPVIWHELTHAIAGDEIRFGGNEEARRIVNEALTEHISSIIFHSSEGSVYDDEEEFAFMSGDTYQKERDTLKDLATNGKIEIAPEIFYEAYTEYDPEFTGFPNQYSYAKDGGGEGEDSFAEAVPKIGPKKQALYDALFEAYPNRKNLDELGDMIVDAFKARQDA